MSETMDPTPTNGTGAELEAASPAPAPSSSPGVQNGGGPNGRATAAFPTTPAINGGHTKDVKKLDKRTRVLPPREAPALAILCFEEPDSPIGQFLGQVANALADRDTPVHLFTPKAFEFFHPAIHVHALGDCSGESILDRVQEFTRRACNAFLREFPAGSSNVSVLGHEWASVPALALLKANKNVPTMLALHSLERQRSNLSSELARQIDEVEMAGLREAQVILTHDSGVGEVAKKALPECAERLTPLCWTFPAHQFNSQLDPGAVKASVQIGPIDPTVLYIGDMDERHGPDLLMKAIPPIVKNNKQVRFVFVGDGALWWPLRVHARYLLLEPVVRMVGSMEGAPLRELIQAADIIVAPSREQTEWWPILAGWASRRPVVTTHIMAKSLELKHEQDSVLIYPDPNSCVWGIERVLFDPELGRSMARRGRQKLDDRFGWGSVAAQIQELMAVPQAR
jgi:D-inositol-3-phosphate glycosyltransferase